MYYVKTRILPSWYDELPLLAQSFTEPSICYDKFDTLEEAEEFIERMKLNNKCVDISEIIKGK